MTQIIAVIQARMGSTRLPGKVMLPLDCVHVINHDIKRVSQAQKIDEVVVATSTETANDIIQRYVDQIGASVFRGSEADVLDRMYQAAAQANADIVVRVTGDCPLISLDTIDKVVERLIQEKADYCSNTIDRTFPRGLDVEAFTFESFKTVHDKATDSHHREHVTPYYHERAEQFECISVTSDEVFDESWMQDRTDLRLTLDEADDYELLREIYDRVEYEGILPIKEAVRLVDEEGLHQLNDSVEQKKYTNASNDQS